jgi:hypothetical protein
MCWRGLFYFLIFLFQNFLFNIFKVFIKFNLYRLLVLRINSINLFIQFNRSFFLNNLIFTKFDISKEHLISQKLICTFFCLFHCGEINILNHLFQMTVYFILRIIFIVIKGVTAVDRESGLKFLGLAEIRAVRFGT